MLQEELEKAKEFLQTEMGKAVNINSRMLPYNFTKDEINSFTKKFQSIDKDKKGYITINDLRTHLNVCEYFFLLSISRLQNTLFHVIFLLFFSFFIFVLPKAIHSYAFFSFTLKFTLRINKKINVQLIFSAYAIQCKYCYH